MFALYPDLLDIHLITIIVVHKRDLTANFNCIRKSSSSIYVGSVRGVSISLSYVRPVEEEKYGEGEMLVK